METIDEEITKASLEYLEGAKKSDKPLFLWCEVVAPGVVSVSSQ